MLRSCLRLCVPFGVTAGLVAVLAIGRAEMPQPLSHEGIVWVYSEARCTGTETTSGCRDLQAERPGFSSFEACLAYRKGAVAQAADQGLLGRCKKERQA